MKNFTLKAFFVLMLFSITAFSQKPENQTSEIIRCLADEHNAQLLQNNPEMMGSKAFEDFIKPKIEAYKAQRVLDPGNTNVVITIPVVVHVLHNGEPVGTGPNITDAQVISQITVMNEDYRRMMGTPGYNTHPDGADVEIEFCLAQRDPLDQASNGIDRVDIGQDGVNEAQMQSFKTTTYWDPSKYMNMWSSKYVGDLNGILGYAQFPGGPANTDGVSASYTYFGSSDYNDGTFNLSPPYDKGRTMTHEVGHFLGLYHTFQDGCADGDLCADTPAVDAPNYGCPTGHVSCGTQDMIENYMDYTDDTCMSVFTNDQKARMVSIMNTYTNRMELGSSNGCTPTQVFDLDGSINIDNLNLVECGNSFTPDIEITNSGNDNLTSGTIEYYLDSEVPTSMPWTGNLALGESAIVSLPTLMIPPGSHTLTVELTSPNGGTDEQTGNNTDSSSSFSAYFETATINLELKPDNYGSETTWQFKNGSGTVLYSGGPYVNNVTTVINETFDVSVGECYTFTILDAYSDGICCSYGTGYYTLTTDDATVVFTGGEFGAQEDTVIGVNTLGVNDYFLNNAISVYPNPVSDKLTIKLSNNDLPDGYKIYNMLGQTISESSISNLSDLEINTSALSNGMYFVKVSKDNSIVTLPFIKN